jgi:hypothetical protein
MEGFFAKGTHWADWVVKGRAGVGALGGLN